MLLVRRMINMILEGILPLVMRMGTSGYIWMVVLGGILDLLRDERPECHGLFVGL